METTIESILADARSRASLILKRSDFESFKAGFMGAQGSMTQVMKSLGNLPKEDRPQAGKLINQAKNELQAIFDEILGRVEEHEIAQSIGAPIDPSLPTTTGHTGGLHLLTQIREQIVTIFHKIGFSVAAGTEVETEHFAFDALNTPKHHPARAEQDTYYLKNEARLANVEPLADERFMLRPHTSSVQIRTMLKNPPPIRIISPGRCFRRDTADATHSANFHQLEGLAVDEGITVSDLKATLDHLFRELLGKDAKIRFRPHFFPYTEPSFEVDFSSAHLKKLGKEWVEIMGCGMVDPTVFASVQYDPEKYTGFAFGMGLERIAMILHGIDDIRHLYTNDLRFLQQFN